MYRGVNSPLAGVAAINAICFGVYGNVNRRLTNPESLRSVTIAGMASGAVQVIILFFFQYSCLVKVCIEKFTL